MNIFLDGSIIPRTSLALGPDLFSLNYAVCAFEGIRTYISEDRTSVFRLDAHLERYHATCAYLGFVSEHLDSGALMRATVSLVREHSSTPLYIRPIAFLDHGIMGLEQHPAVRSCIFTQPIAHNPVSPVIRLGISFYPRDVSTIARKISRNYFDPYFGLKNKPKFADDLLFLDNARIVTETSAHNVFFVRPNGTVETPRTSHCLPGITRDAVFKLLAARDVIVTENDIHESQLNEYIACFTTSTASEIRIVREIEAIAYEVDNPVVQQLISDFRSAVNGLNTTFEEWNCYV